MGTSLLSMTKTVENVEGKKAKDFCDTVKGFLNTMQELGKVPEQSAGAKAAGDVKAKPKKVPENETTTKQLSNMTIKLVRAYGIFVDATLGTMMVFPPFRCERTRGITEVDKWWNKTA